MQLSINRYFKHKHFNNVIKSTMKKGLDGSYHLYINLVHPKDGEIVGMSESQEFMIATSLQQDDWKTILEKWASENQYLDYQPKRFTCYEAQQFLNNCRQQMVETSGYRLGQAIINNLGENTPTPNIDIFTSNDEMKVLDWFYKNHVME